MTPYYCAIYLFCIWAFVSAQPVPHSIVLDDAQLQKMAHQAFMQSKYKDAAQYNLRIANNFPASKHRRYAVMMLGMIYENNLFRYDSAIYWYKEFLAKYAKARQADAMLRRIEFMNGLGEHREAHIAFRKIQLSEDSIEQRIKKLEAFVAAHPNFPVMKDVLMFLAGDYKAAGKYWKYYRAFNMGLALDTASSPELRARYRSYARSIFIRSLIARLGWLYLIILFIWTLFLKPWKTISMQACRNFCKYIIAWAILAITGVTAYKFGIADADNNPFSILQVIAFLCVNFLVLGWMFLFQQTEFWKKQNRVLTYLLPLFALLSSVFLSWIVLCTQEAWIGVTDEFMVQWKDFFDVVGDFF